MLGEIERRLVGRKRSRWREIGGGTLVRKRGSTGMFGEIGRGMGRGRRGGDARILQKSMSEGVDMVLGLLVERRRAERVTRCLDAEARAVSSRDGDHDSVAQMNAAAEALETKEQQKPSFELSGKLAEETNRVRGVTILFTEPPEARKPDIRWRLYVFKAGEVLNEPLYVHRQSCYLFGRERRVADVPTDHPSCSKQHAVLQFRLVEKEQPDGLMSKEVRPYVMDLDSTNGTFINENRIEPRRYYELFEKDTIKFGNSSREYVLLHEHSTG
ncbi:FHA domain-containing protein DDL isoform X3 [Typha latifolia]|uniref:FHA domain-containing protein DDL isoform X3 n=1 Tax=Typha latifolia TaxID=4733 RepID=UPI003C302D59